MVTDVTSNHDRRWISLMNLRQKVRPQMGQVAKSQGVWGSQGTEKWHSILGSKMTILQLGFFMDFDIFWHILITPIYFGRYFDVFWGYDITMVVSIPTYSWNCGVPSCDLFSRRLQCKLFDFPRPWTLTFRTQHWLVYFGGGVHKWGYPKIMGFNMFQWHNGLIQRMIWGTWVPIFPGVTDFVPQS